MKFESLDRRYKEKRKQISQKYGKQEMWSIIDHWPLYCGISNLGRYMAIAELFKESLNIPGHIAEFGSWKGSNLLFIAKLLKIYDPHGCKEVYCFDSFEGLETFTKEDKESQKIRNAYKGNFTTLEEIIALYDLTDDINICKGVIQDTLPELIKDNPAIRFSFIYCDTDLYEPTSIIVDKLHKHLSKGGLFIFDEWNDSRWPGEGIAVNRFLEEFGDSYHVRHVKYARQPTLILEKIKC